MKKKLNVRNVANLQGHKGGIYALEQADDSQCFYSADGAGWVVKWNLNQTDTAHLIAKVPSNIFSLCLVKDQQLLAVGSLQGVLYFIDLPRKKVLTPPLQFSKTIYDVQQWKNYLLIATGDGKLSVFNLESWEIEKTLDLSEKSIRQVKVQTLQKKALVASSDHCIYSVNLEKMEVESCLTHHKNSVFCLQLLKNGQRLFAGSRDAHLSIWEENKPSFTLQHTIPAHLFTINDLALSPSEQWLATASRDKSLKIWDVESLNLLKVIDRMKPTLDAHSHSVNTLLWSSFNDYLISGSDDKVIKVWEVVEE